MTHLERQIRAKKKEVRKLEKQIHRAERIERHEARRKRMNA